MHVFARQMTNLRNRIAAATVFAFFVCASVIGTASAQVIQPSDSVVDAKAALTAVYAKRGDLQRFFDATTWLATGAPQTAGIIDLEHWARLYGYAEHPDLAPYYAPNSEAVSARTRLADVFAERADLQRFFDATTWLATGAPQTAGITDLEHWARLYGHREYPVMLSAYAPDTPVASSTPPPAAPTVPPTTLTSTVPAPPAAPAVRVPDALVPIVGAPRPALRAGAVFDPASITASKVIVIDPVSRRVILEQGADEPHVMASITKLMTAMLVLDAGVPLSRTHAIIAADEVGGARLNVSRGTPLTVQQLFMTMLVGSANNAAHALSRTTGTDTPGFVAAMNRKAARLGLAATTFTDPSGMDTGNVSTARDMAALLIESLMYQDIRRGATTAQYAFVAEGTSRNIRNTNGLLVDPNNGLYVLGGKTGFLNASRWNLAVHMRGTDAPRQPGLVIVTLGSASQVDSFKDSERIARWTWNNLIWQD